MDDSNKLFQDAVLSMASSMKYMIDETAKGGTQVYDGIVFSQTGNKCTTKVNGKEYSLPIYGEATLSRGTIVKVVVPQGNMSSAFILPFKSGTSSSYRYITNDTSITPSGTYATSTYYNTSYGVKIGYMPDGNILLSMQAGTSTDYEYLRFYASSVPSGVTVTSAYNTSTSYVTAAPGMIYACVISGIDGKATIDISMNTVNSSYDYVRCDITVTYV